VVIAQHHTAVVRQHIAADIQGLLVRC
jgi:hypothetical protein